MGIKKEKNPYRPFTRDWFEHVWAYDKLYLALVILVCFGIVRYYMAIDNDVEIRFFGPELRSEQVSALQSDFGKLTKDNNRDGRKHLHLNIKSYSDSFANLFGKGKATVQIMPKAMVALYLANNKNVLTDLSQLAKEYNVVESRLFSAKDKVYAIQIGDNSIFKGKNIFTPDLYLVIRGRSPKEESSRSWAASYENGLEIAKYLLEHNMDK